MKIFLFSLFLLLVCASTAEAATIYIDNAASMTTDCTSSNYSIANRNCTGSSGNAYRTMQAALSASAAKDNIYFRTGSYTNNASSPFGIFPLGGQTWATCPAATCPTAGMPNRATITTNTQRSHFQIENVDGVIIKDLILIGGTEHAIYADYATNYIIEGNDISNSNTSITAERDMLSLGDCCGDGFFGGSPNIQYSAGAIVRNNYLHDVNVSTSGATAYDNACLKTANGSGFLITGNICERAGNGIWHDIASGTLARGKTPHTMTNNTVRDINEYCFHFEIGSSGTMQNNTAVRCGLAGVFVRPGDISSWPNIDQLKIQNNTFYDLNSGIHIQQDGTAKLINARIENNIVYAITPTNYLLTAGAASAADATNTWRNNLLFSQNNSNGICWNQPLNGGNLNCLTGTGATGYADTSAGISSWQAACSGGRCAGNIAGNPLFANPTGEDFRLCTAAGVPHASCTGRSPAIDAGLNIGLPFTGSAPDIGALETSVAPPPPFASRYADGSNPSGCSNGSTNYNPTTRVCSGGAGSGSIVHTGGVNALQNAITASAAGETISVRSFSGVYTGTGYQGGIATKAGLNISNKSIIEGYGSENPVVQGIGIDGTVSFVHVRNLIIDGAASSQIAYGIVGFTFSRFENILMRNVAAHGVFFISDSELINVSLDNIGWRAHIGQEGCTGFACTCGLNDHTCHGIYFSDNVTIDGGVWSNIRGYAIHCSPTCNGVTIKNMRIHHNKAWGLYLSFGANNFAYNNVVHENDSGIWLVGSGVVNNNTSYGNINTGICLSGQNNKTVQNNISIGNGASPQIDVTQTCGGQPPPNPTGITISNNITTGPASMFVDAAKGDFRLASPNNAGLPLAAPYNTDITGALRSVPFDAGAYEFGAAPANTPPVVTITTNGGDPISTPNSTGQTLNASCVDNVACSSATWSSNRYGANGTCTGTSTLTCTTGTLPVGESIITITALDGSGASGADTISITYTPTHPGDSIVLAMGFSENTGTSTADSSGNNNNGTLAGGATWTGSVGPSGKYGSGIRFDGTSGSVNVADSNSLDLTQGLTIEAWVFPETGGSTYQVILQKNGAGSITSPPYFLIGVSGICGSNVPDGGIIVNDDGNPRNACAGPPLIQNIWTHLALTYDGKVLTLYKDGVSVMTLVQTGLMVPTTGSLTIGRAGANGFRGVLDEIRMANYARSGAVGSGTCDDAGLNVKSEIQCDMDTPVTAPVPPTAVKISSGSTRKFASGTTQQYSQ